jgi:SAM-dependent methyltransferase
VLSGLPDSPADTWLDLGCGSGALAVEWLQAGRQSAYFGVDFSKSLLEEAELAVSSLPGHERVSFSQVDLASPDWTRRLPGGFTGVLSFAVLHHLPSQEMRRRLVREVSNLLPPGGRFFLSVWQFQNSPKLLARRIAWEQAGLHFEDLEPGDTLLDWRAADTQKAGNIGLRYIHQFRQDELVELAQSAGFQVAETYDSDGQGGRLGLYQVWVKLVGQLYSNTPTST